MRSPFSSRSSQAGSTLVDVLMALGLLGVAFTLFIPYGKQIMERQSAADLIRQRTLLKSMLLTAVSCGKAEACSGDDFKELADLNDNILVNRQGTSVYGPWQVRAQCQPDMTIDVKVASIQNGQFKKEPLTGKLLDWDHPNARILQPGVLCGKLTAAKSDAEIVPVRSRFCLHDQGSCPPPPQSLLIPGGPARMCCETGIDVRKPSCPRDKLEIGAYWDRDGDWGADGSWVVLCQ